MNFSRKSYNYGFERVLFAKKSKLVVNNDAPLIMRLSYVVRCAIWYYLYNLKNVKNTHGRVLVLVTLGIPEKWDPGPYGGTLRWSPKVVPYGGTLR